MKDVRLSSESVAWTTPWEVFRAWDMTHGNFDMDVCATPESAKCENYITWAESLAEPWFGTCWLNPMYDASIGPWIAKAMGELHDGRADRVVSLLPARIDTAWWHDLVIPYGEIHFLRGLVMLEGIEYVTPLPSAIVIFD
ncbi:phage N-6-adenine-methyltransferase [Desulfovibrio sp. OttesenSCG-928-A18]|nr:phage N-6-adenine-methyltransferase [Desulfovibrio sp. OttesenSCG-928-A18]